MPAPSPSRGVLRRAWWQMGSDLWLQGVAITILTVALAIVGTYLAVCLNLQQAGRKLSMGSTLTVVLEDGALPEQGRALARRLAEDPTVAEVRLMPKEQGLARFRRQLGPQANLLEGLEENPLPDLLEVFLVPGRGDPVAVTDGVRGQPGVVDVLTSRPWLHRLEATALSLTEAAWILGSLLFLGVVLLSANTVRLAVYVRRDQLAIMELVGASPGYIRRPFLLEALMQTLLAALLASLLVWGLMALMRGAGELPLGLDLADLLTFPWQAPAALFILAVIAGLLGGYLGVGRALRPRGLP